MAFFDLTGDALRSFRSSAVEPDDFDAFWARTLEETRSHPLEATFTPVDTGLRLVEVHDVAFAGWNGERVRGWLTLPTGPSRGDGPLPAVVQYVGYGGGRGHAHTPPTVALAGFATLVMDTRGQGSTWSPGHTGDPDPSGTPQIPGFMTRGVLDPDGYYYRRLYADAVRAVEAVRAHPEVDASRVAVTGGSQGGGMTIAVAGLVPDLVAAIPDVPFLCDIRRATTLVDSDPYHEVARYCRTHVGTVEQVFRTLAYVDGVHLARRATAPALFGVGLMDQVCPPSTIYAAYNAWGGAKDIREYEYNGHEGGQGTFEAERIAFLHKAFGTEA